MSPRSWRPIVLVWVVAAVAAAAAAEATVTAQQSNTTSIDCQRCSCGRQSSVFTLHCRLTGTEDVVLDGPGPLDFSVRTLYMRVENASSLHVGAAFLGALRRYQSVAFDIWNIGNLTFDTEYLPKEKLLFMGFGISNCSLPELPRGVVSNTNAVGFRLSGSRVGVIRRGFFAYVNKIRYIELKDSSVGTVEGPQIGVLLLNHRKEVHHGSLGVLVQRCRIGVIQHSAIIITLRTADEFVEISHTTIAELGPGGLRVRGEGSFLVNHTTFGYLGSGALDISTFGNVSLLNTRVTAAAPVPFSLISGGNDTRLDNVTFCQPPSASLLQLRWPTGEERLRQLRFACSELRPGWTAPAVAGQHTVVDGLRRYMAAVEAAAECDPSAAAGGPVPGTGDPSAAAGGPVPGTGPGTEPRSAAALQPGGAAGGGGMFSNPGQVGLELLILTLIAAVAAAVAAIGAALARRRRWWRPSGSIERRELVEEAVEP